MQKVSAFAVTAYGNKTGWYPAGISINLDCHTDTFVANETINPAVGGGTCRYEPGTAWPNGAPAGVTVVSTVKMNTPNGFVWIAAADYASFVTSCNACCVEQE